MAFMSRSKALRRDLIESVTQPGKLVVDRAAGVIRGALLCGRESNNSHGSGAKRTVYTERAFQDALSLYEGATAFASHGDKRKPDAERHPRDAIGVYKDVRLEGGQPRADIHYFRGNELAESIADDAERGLGAFKLSHNAQGDGPVKGGVLTIESIYRVRSVDVVTRGATTRNLAESPEGGRMKLREYLESLKALPAARLKRVRTLLEDDAGLGDMPMDAPPEPPADEGAGNPDDALQQGFEAACVAVLKGDLPVKEKVAKLKELLTAQDKLIGEGTDPTPEPEPEPDEPDEEPADDDEGTKMESLELKKENAKLKRRERARELCEAAKVTADRALLESLEALPDEAAMSKLIRRVGKGRSGGAPRSSAPNGRDLPESGEYREPADLKDFTSRLYS